MADLYIGKTFNPTDRSLGEPFRLDSSDLTTHGIVIGMTGSGKTGLSVCLIEEALRAKIPVIVVDPKGDMGNLALAFDRLAPDQFEPWIDRDEAAREGKTPAQVAADTAATWAKGLADWGLAAADVAAYANSRRVRIFTPGASAGIPINLIDDLSAPGGDFEANEEEYRDEIDSIVTALLGFVKIDADPVSSREYILLFSLIEAAWRKGHDLDLETLIAQVANPPIGRVGALPLESFYPGKERNGLMFALNNLVASPPFEIWRKGEPIDIESWVRTPDGVPQLTIVSTAHLDDEQRIFVTALVLNKLKTWMRKQPGTSELRCLFYMDEIFGYFPPTANPPTKKPLLTLLKQARAYGVGVLLSTQNPVDLDYKGLANMGFWAIGRLQTEQDQRRVREGIEAALAEMASGLSFDDLIGGVQKRVFLIHDIHRKAPTLVHSRWAMSYLRGPITRDEIRALRGAGAPEQEPEKPLSASQEPAAERPPRTESGPPPVVAPPLPPPFRGLYFRRHGGNVAHPYIYVRAGVRYKAAGLSTAESVHQMAFALSPGIAPGEILESDPIEIDEGAFEGSMPPGITFADLPLFITDDGSRPVERVLKDRLDDKFQVELLYDPQTKTWGHPGEDEYAFALRIRAVQAPSAKRQALEARLTKKRSELQIRSQEASGRKLEKWASLGTSILSNISIFSGRKRRVTGVGTVLTKSRMEGTAERRKDVLESEIADIERQLSEMAEVDPSRFERKIVKPTKTDISIIRFDLVWVY